MPITSKAAILRAVLGVFPIHAFTTSRHEVSPILCRLSWACDEGLVFKEVAAEANLQRSMEPYIAIDENTAHKDNSYSKDILLSSIYSIVVSICNHSKPFIQFYGLQILELWLQRVEEYVTVHPNWMNSKSLLLERLMEITSLLTQHWSHPSKKVSHLVPAVYRRLIDLISFIDAQSVVTDGNGSKSGNVYGHKDDVWTAFIEKALSLPLHHRARYQALYTLLPKIGASRFLALQPSIIATLLPSTMKVRDIASSVCNFLTTLLYGIHNDRCEQMTIKFPNKHGAVRKNKEKYTPIDNEVDKIAVRSLWIPYLVASLCHGESKIVRVNSADYLLYSLLDYDPHAASAIIDHIRALPSTTCIGCKLWGLVNVVLQCRLLSIEMSEISVGVYNDNLAPKGPLLSHEAYWACMSDDTDLRLCAVNMLPASKAASLPFPSHEFDILKRVLPYLLKSALPDHRHKLSRMVKTLMNRVKEAARQTRRNAEKERKRLTAKGENDHDNPILAVAEECSCRYIEVTNWYQLLFNVLHSLFMIPSIALLILLGSKTC